MRIIGGEYGGRKLIPPKGDKIRPTTDRMRETIFNILGHSPVSLKGARVLDVFAGTGALGLEALSRGAAHATFFDKDPTALALVKKNIAVIGAEDKTTIKCIIVPDVPRYPAPYDIIFIDPPYNLTVINDTLDSLRKNEYFASDHLIIIERSSTNSLIYPDYFDIYKEKTYGDSHVSFLI